MANRCTAADAECLRGIRQSGQYKRLGLTWEEFCSQRAGVSRRHADRLIGHLEEFGANYFRLAELTEVTPATYRLIAGAVTDAGIQVEGETIPIHPDNREKIAAVVDAARQQAKPAPEAAARAPHVAAVRQRLHEFLDSAVAACHATSERAELMLLLEEGERRIGALSQQVRRKTLVVE